MGVINFFVSTASMDVYPLCKRRLIFSRDWDQLHVIIVMGQQHTEDIRLSRSCRRQGVQGFMLITDSAPVVRSALRK